MKIKVIKCSDSRLWYSSRLNEVFDVRRIDTDCYWTKPNPEDPYAGWNYVLFEDCEIYKEPE